MAKAIAPGIFAFVGVVVGLFWNDHRERRVREIRYAHEANMLHRVMVADLEIAKHVTLGALKAMRNNTSGRLTIELPKVRDYSIEQFGRLTAIEIEPVLIAIGALKNLRKQIERGL